MKLVQLFIPLTAANAKQVLTELKEIVTQKFGGVTCYTQAPAEGIWREGGTRIVKDEVIVVEVMSANVDLHWWTELRASLEAKLEQEELLVRAFDVQRI